MGSVVNAAEAAFVSKPLTAGDPCADIGFIKKSKKNLFFALVDIAGHGTSAFKLAGKIEDYINGHYENPDLAELVKGLHVELRSSRGAVGTFCRFEPAKGELHYVSIGNVALRIFGKIKCRTIPQTGIIGYVIPTLHQYTLKIKASDVAVLYTDGIKDHFEIEDAPKKILEQKAKTIAAALLKSFDKGNDDCGCIALTYRAKT